MNPAKKARQKTLKQNALRAAKPAAKSFSGQLAVNTILIGTVQRFSRIWGEAAAGRPRGTRTHN
ncbi:MAG: hypothetical protein ACK8QZ_11810, partial [Anaerolineales bacterium]